MIGEQIVSNSIQLDRVLNRASAGLELAKSVLDHLAAHESVELDFSPVDRITPSFANAFVMTILAANDSRLPENLFLLNRNDLVEKEISLSISAYSRGLRLSTQLA
jgi:hypothetical protein